MTRDPDRRQGAGFNPANSSPYGWTEPVRRPGRGRDRQRAWGAESGILGPALTLARYRLGALLAKTPSSEVYAATQLGAEGFERPVAVKVLSPEALADPKARDRFAWEARAMAQLRHPNILAVLDFVILDGREAQVLELIDGLSAHMLLGKLPEPRLPPPQAVWIVLEVLRGLDYAHQAVAPGGGRLLSHRDLSTHNVLLSDRGEVKLADFGVAAWSRAPEQTAVGVARGTLDFMSPEQLRGDPVDARTDVFGIGCLLHTLLVGVSPLQSSEARDALLAGTPIRLDERVPPSLRAPLALALRPDLRQRQASLAALRGELLRSVGPLNGDPTAELAMLVQSHRSAQGAGRPSDRLGAVQALVAQDFAEEPPRQGTRPVWNDGGTEPTASSFTADATAPVTITKKVLRAGSVPDPQRSPGVWLAVAVALSVGVGGSIWWAAGRRTEVSIAPIPQPPPPLAVSTPRAEPLPIVEPHAPAEEKPVEIAAPTHERAGSRVRRVVDQPQAPPPSPIDPTALWRRLEVLSKILERRVSGSSLEQSEAWERAFLDLQIQARQARTQEELQRVSRELGALEQSLGVVGGR